MGDETRKRPWLDRIGRYGSGVDAYAEFAAWESWMEEQLETMSDGPPALDERLTVTQRAYLFNLMGRLADGEPIPAVVPAGGGA